MHKEIIIVIVEIDQVTGMMTLVGRAATESMVTFLWMGTTSTQELSTPDEDMIQVSDTTVLDGVIRAM